MNSNKESSSKSVNSFMNSDSGVTAADKNNCSAKSVNLMNSSSSDSIVSSSMALTSTNNKLDLNNDNASKCNQQNNNKSLTNNLVDSKTNATLPTSSSTGGISSDLQAINNNSESISVNNNAKSNSRKSVELNSIKVEIKQESDADKAKNNAGTINSNVTSSLGGGVLPPHAAAAKHPVSTMLIFIIINLY